MSSVAHIVCDPAVLSGKPVIAGTRLSVELILEKLAAGRTLEELLADGVQAALTFALQTLRNEAVYPPAG